MVKWVRSLVVLTMGAVLGGTFIAAWEHSAEAQQQAPVTQATLVDDVRHLRDITPQDGHAMEGVAMFATNLWFAGNHKNWGLANYYLGKMRDRIAWETRIEPGNGFHGNPADMANIFDGIDKSTLTRLKSAIAAKDGKEFDTQYRHLLEDCYSCHKTANRPYLRPQVPRSEAGAQQIVNLDPNATWPQ